MLMLYICNYVLWKLNRKCYKLCGSFVMHIYIFLGATLWRVVADSLGVLRVARQHTITDDTYRSPQVDLLLGNHGWVQHVDNRVK